jgi:hypothetical protein
MSLKKILLRGAGPQRGYVMAGLPLLRHRALLSQVEAAPWNAGPNVVLLGMIQNPSKKMVVLGMVYENYWDSLTHLRLGCYLVSCMLWVHPFGFWLKNFFYAVLKKGERIGGLTSSMLGCSSTY